MFGKPRFSNRSFFYLASRAFLSQGEVYMMEGSICCALGTVVGAESKHFDRSAWDVNRDFLLRVHLLVVKREVFMDLLYLKCFFYCTFSFTV